MTPLETPATRRILIVEDDPVMRESLGQALELEGYTIDLKDTGAGALETLSSSPAPLAVLCDIRLPDMTGEAVFETQRSIAPSAFLFMTGFGEIDQAVRLVRAGASDYLTKPFEVETLLERLAAFAPKEVDDDAVLGTSNAMREIETLIRKIASNTSPVLFTGETGVGKGFCAQRLHALSRPDSPFISVNCAAIPSQLLESEIFGHERGVFPGAEGRHLGYAERAGAGALFLDEIGAAPPEIQAKLLQLFEDGTFFRLGGEEPVPFRARIFAATNRDPASQPLPADLLHRLSAFTLHIPPLRSRPDDVAWLLSRFVAMFAESTERPIRGVGQLAIEAARVHDWPGNVRELRNRAERAVVLGKEQWIMSRDLFPPRKSEPHSQGALAVLRERMERRAIMGALKDSDGRPGDAAQLLGISRTTLWEKMKRLGVST